MKTKDKQISNRNKTTTIGRFRSLPPCLLGSLPPSSFLIAKRNIRTSANPRVFSTLTFSNREKSSFSHFRPSTAFLIYTRKIRNRRKPQRLSHLHFSNLYKSRAFFLSPRAARSMDLLPETPWLPRFRASLETCYIELKAMVRPPHVPCGAVLIHTRGFDGS